MNFVQNVANQVMTPPAFSNKAAFAVWAVSTITLTCIASTVLSDLASRMENSSNVPNHFRSDASTITAAGVVKYTFPKLVYAGLGIMGLIAAKSNDTARMAALGVVAFGYFSSRNNILTIFNGHITLNILSTCV